jgi:ubiquinone biosynthesis accessory factor UbiK
MQALERHEAAGSTVARSYNRRLYAPDPAIEPPAKGLDRPDRGVPPMLDPKHFDELVQRLSSAMPKGFQMLQEDINRNLRASLESGLSRLDLVTREEFDVQSAVLARTRQKLSALESQVAALEAALSSARAPQD